MEAYALTEGLEESVKKEASNAHRKGGYKFSSALAADMSLNSPDMNARERP
jgi:hypothetical protein